MSDISAADYREAAYRLTMSEDTKNLLLAAAEQREQLDLAYAELERLTDPVSTGTLEAQIATLTAELIDARHRIMELELEKK